MMCENHTSFQGLLKHTLIHTCGTWQLNASCIYPQSCRLTRWQGLEYSGYRLLCQFVGLNGDQTGVSICYSSASGYL